MSEKHLVPSENLDREPTPQERFQFSLKLARAKVFKRLREARDNIDLLLSIQADIGDGELYATLQKIDNCVGGARGQMMAVRTWKESLELLKHLKEEGRI